MKLDETTPNVKLTRVPRPPVPPPSKAQQQADEALNGTMNSVNNTTNNGPVIGRPPNTSSPTSNNRSRGGINQASPTTKNTSVEPTEVRTKVIKGVKTVDWEAELTDFYDSVGAAQKIPGIPAILKAWAGKEEQMIQNLIKKYEGNIPKKMLAQLERIYGFLETQTEVSNARSPIRAGRR